MKLVLRREALADLSTTDLLRVRGGYESGVTGCAGLTGCHACDEVTWLLDSAFCPLTR